MYQKKITITIPHGLHARPAAKFVKEAKKFSSAVKIISDENEINAKSLFKIQSLGLIKGKSVILFAEGQDEKEAVEHLSNLLIDKKNDL